MKKALLFVTMFIFAMVLASCESRPTLKVFMPNEYIDVSLFEAFEDAFNVRVELITFDSNETALPQIKVNSYDVVIPSDYAIEELAQDGLLEVIDWSLFDSITQDDLEDSLQTLISEMDGDVNGFNLLDYAVPYFWGNVGLLYDRRRVSETDIMEAGWDILNTLDDDVMFYDSSRDMVMVALKALFGGSVNVNNPLPTELLAAENWLIGANRTSKVTYASDEIFDDMLDPARYAVAVSYSGDAVFLMSENEHLGYYVPTRGSNVWIDGMVIPKNAQQKELAYAFINYMSSLEVMYSNSEYVGYTAPRSDVASLIIENEVYDMSSYKMVVTLNDSAFRYNTANKQAIEELWARVRALN